MARIWELLDKVYLLINAGHVRQARIVIEQILSRDPQNIEAWGIYIDTFDTNHELENLKVVLQTVWESYVQDKDYLNANRRYILRRINERIANL